MPTTLISHWQLIIYNYAHSQRDNYRGRIDHGRRS